MLGGIRCCQTTEIPSAGRTTLSDTAQTHVERSAHRTHRSAISPNENSASWTCRRRVTCQLRKIGLTTDAQITKREPRMRNRNAVSARNSESQIRAAVPKQISRCQGLSEAWPPGNRPVPHDPSHAAQSTTLDDTQCTCQVGAGRMLGAESDTERAHNARKRTASHEHLDHTGNQRYVDHAKAFAGRQAQP